MADSLFFKVPFINRHHHNIARLVRDAAKYGRPESVAALAAAHGGISD